MKKYELIKEGNTWKLYFFDSEFNQWVFIRPYKNTETIKKIYDDIKKTYKHLNYNILVKFNFNI